MLCRVAPLTFTQIENDRILSRTAQELGPWLDFVATYNIRLCLGVSALSAKFQLRSSILLVLQEVCIDGYARTL